ncbi:MAG: A/G-specific adenine glycosylase [Oscillospiraceae bacterium]|nr:A/G-specific adenine glycosylase [Oscillospiraceae bacterium]
METASLASLPELLLPWYRENRRDLPWRADRDPYHIWVSEIMLQQTRVEAVKGYYARFLAALPTVETLANCDDEPLHKLWEGLGYYSRVRNLKKAAQILVTQYHGQFPQSYSEILALPGIGEYTAGAICSIAFSLPTPAVDGNVLRVLSRLRDDPTPIDLPDTKKQVRFLLERIYPKDAGDFTQSLMELGATICGPNRAPDCGICPCREICLGFKNGTAHSLPVKSPKKPKRQEKRTVFIFSCDGKYALEKRPERGLLAGLWQFPNLPEYLDLPDILSATEAMGLSPRELKREVFRKHIFTHIQWDMKGIYLEVANTGGRFQWFTKKEIEEQAALPTAFRQFWEEAEYV